MIVKDQINEFLGKEVTTYGKLSTGADYCHKGIITEIKPVNNWAGNPAWYYLTIDGGKKFSLHSWSELETNSEGKWHIREEESRGYTHTFIGK